MTVSELETQVLDAAKMLGWRLAHARPALTKKGWRTALSGDAGFPDFCMIRRGRMVFVECKGKSNNLEPEQQAWRDAIEAVPGVEYHLLRPSGLVEFVRTVLSAR